MKECINRRLVRVGELFLTVVLGIFVAAAPIQEVVAQGQRGNANNGPGTAKVLIGLKGPVRPNDIRVVETFGGKVTHAFDLVNVIAAQIPDTAAFRNLLRQDERVTYVEPDLEVHALAQELPTGVDRMEVDGNATASIGNWTKVDVDIAVIDTGVDLDHPDLNVHQAVDATRGPGPTKGGDGDDDNGHGTHVAGIAAAKDNNEGVVGVAPGARIWGVKVLKSDGSGRLSDIIEGMQYVTDNADEIEVANMSIGTNGEAESQSWHDALKNSVNAGVVYTIAAGNSAADVFAGNGPDSDGDGIIDGYLPAAYPEAAAISALADSDGLPGGEGGKTSYGADDSFATFSNFSREDFPNDSNPVSSPGGAIDLMLPGVDIRSTWMGGGYNTISGTSMASPHAAGAAALFIVAKSLSPNSATDVYDIRQGLIDGGVKQSSSKGLVNGGDPDSNPERLAWLGEGVPSVSWVSPTDGQEVSGSAVPIQITASDGEDVDDNLTVEWRVDGSTWSTASYNLDSGYYEATWDSTGVSDGDHILDARVTDSDSNTGIATITVTTDNTEDPPSVDSLSVSEVETDNGDAEFDASWEVSDPNGDLKSVELVLTDSSNSEQDSVTVSISGDTASGTTRLVASGDDGSANSYEVTATVSDSAGNNDSASVTVTESEGGNAPTVDTHMISEAGSPNPHLEITVDWGVSDVDGDLSLVRITAEDTDGSAFADTNQYSVTGSSASGTDTFKFTHVGGETADVTIYVEDSAGESASRTEQVTE